MQGVLTIGRAARPTAETRALEGVWLAFAATTDEGAARRRYLAEYGREPERVLRRLGLLLLGPVGEQTSESLADFGETM